MKLIWEEENDPYAVAGREKVHFFFSFFRTYHDGEKRKGRGIVECTATLLVTCRTDAHYMTYRCERVFLLYVQMVAGMP